MDTAENGTVEQPSGSRLSRFFFSEEVPYGMALVRIFLCSVLLFVMLQRWPHAREFYSTDGATAPLAVSYGYFNFLPEFSGPVAVALASALVFFLVCSGIGWCTRFSLAAACSIYVYLNMLDAMSSMTKYSVIAAHGLLLLCISNCGAVWSVDSWIKGYRQRNHWPGERKIERPRYPIWPARLLQLLIVLVYFGAALTKMQTPAYFNGDQLVSWVMTHVNFQHPLGEYLVLFPPALVTFAYFSIVWEVLIPFLVWKESSRFWMLGLGVAFHLGTTLILGLYIFPMVCISIYLAFVTEKDIQKLSAFSRKFFRKHSDLAKRIQGLAAWQKTFPIPQISPQTSVACFLLAVLGFTFAGLEVENLIDPYGKNGPNGPLALKELDAAEVRKMLTQNPTLREKDKFLSMDVGTRFISGLLGNRRDTFHYGETFYVQCNLVPPHDDMWVECIVHDTEDRVLERVGQIVTREQMRSNFFFSMKNSIKPGDYFLVLKSKGREITRKKITLLPKISVTAN